MAKKKQKHGSPPPNCPVAAVGASAGGLEAFHRFLDVLPARFGFALIFIQHLSAKHKSLLAEICRSQRNDLDIVEITNGLELQPCRVYVSPPGQQIRIEGDAFRLAPIPPGEKVYQLIDGFLSNLAEEKGELSIAVILSGAGNDGARGLRAIKEAGGMIFAQDPATAGHTSMPLAAIDTGNVDHVLSPEKIALEIAALQFSCAEEVCKTEPPQEEWVRDFLWLISENTGYRFDHYKPSVAGRRIKRRMILRGASTTKDYLEMVRNGKTEAMQLASDLMIGVTAFFRDEEPWTVMRKEVFPRLIAGDGEGPIRIWTPACSTGEETYTVAMLLLDELERSGCQRELQIFATDLNDRTLEKAREGRYPVSVAVDIPANMVRKYFNLSDDGLTLIATKEMRERIVFAAQNLVADPPFSRLDLIICRNLLIYLEPKAQEKCIDLFHYALNEGGFLFLGNAESAGTGTLFECIDDRKCRIYRKIGQRDVSLPAFTRPSPDPIPPALDQLLSTPQTTWQTVVASAQESLLEEFAPAAVAFDRHYEILYHNGPTHRYLRQPRGLPTRNLLDLLSQNLRGRMRSALYRCIHEDRPIAIHAELEGEGGRKARLLLRLTALREGLYLLVFREESGRVRKGAKKVALAEAEESALRQLEIELEATKDDLRRQMEQAHGVNEELHSSNEELQAANEELETSREELQSLNEELTTVNAQLQAKLEELEQANNDLDNFLNSTSIPTIFLDRELKVKRFTPAMTGLVRLIPADAGRMLVDLSYAKLGPELLADTQMVLESITPVSREIEVDGRNLIRKVLPYRTATDRIEGVVVTYTDITELRESENRARHLATFPELNPNPVLETDGSGQVTYANPSSSEILESRGLNRQAVASFLPQDMEEILEDWNRKDSRIFEREITIGDRFFAEAVHLVPGLDAVRIYAHDITERKLAGRKLLNRNLLLEGIGRIFQQAMSVQSQEELGQTCLEVAEKVTQSRFGFIGEIGTDGMLHDVAISDPGWTLCTMYDQTGHRRPPGNFTIHGLYGRVLQDGKSLLTNDPTSHPASIGTPQGHPPLEAFLGVPLLRNGETVGVVAVGNREGGYGEEELAALEALAPVVVEAFLRMRAEEALRESEARLSRSQEVAHLGSWELDLVNNELTWSDEVYRIFGLDPQKFGATYETFLETVHPDDRTAVDEAYTSSLREDLDTYEIEHRAVRANGEIRHVHEKCQHFRDKNGAIVRSIGMVHDITERKMAEEAIIKWSERHALLADAARLLLTSETPEHILQEICEGVMSYLGCENFFNYLTQEGTELLHLNAVSGIPEEEAAKFEWLETGSEVSSCVAHDGKRFVAEDLAHNQDQRLQPLRDFGYQAYACHPLIFQDRTIGTLAFGTRGRTAFTDEELGLMRAVADLVAVVLVRRRSKEELTQARDLAEERARDLETSIKELEGFTYSVSHDLRAPIRHIITFADLLRKKCWEELNDKGRQYLEVISTSSRNLGTLTDELLEFSRMGRLPLQKTYVNLTELAGELIETLNRQIESRRIDWQLDTLPQVEGDTLMLRLVLGNLLTNAVKFTGRRDEGRIEIGHRDEKGEHVIFIKDNGAGFDMQHAGKLFGVFQRLHRAEEFEGTGIGLANVARIINRHGGRVWAEGAVDEGATFYFSLPQSEAKAGAES